MGHYDVCKTVPMDTTSSPVSDVYRNFRGHCSGKRVHTDLATIVAIRNAHPDCHVTPVNARSCDLAGFANGGHGTANIQCEGDNFIQERTYNPPRTRLEEGDGTLGDRVHFGFYRAAFFDQPFEFYHAQWRDELFGNSVKNYYILSPKASADTKGHSAEVDKLILTASKWTSDLHDEIYVFDAGMWTKNKQLWAAVQNSTWDDVILDPNMKETLISDVQNFFDSRSLYEEYAVPWKRGIIFHGTPGCGKTISIKALMNSLQRREMPVASLYVKSFKACQGDEYSIREIFQQARIMAPCMLVFEDLDSLVKNKVRSYFLNEVDGLEDNNGILMIGSTNHLERLDPGISKRPSRFDRKYHFKIPGKRERMFYCDYWKKKLERNSNVDFDPAICEIVAELTDGFSFAYLKELFVQTLLTIVGGRENEVDTGDVEAAAEEAKIVENSSRLAGPDGKVESTAEDGQDTSFPTDNADTKPKEEPKVLSVHIPEDLKSNPLMRVLHKQSIALWKDMDNTKDEEAGVKKGGAKKDDDDDDEKDDDPEPQTRTRVIVLNQNRD